MKNTWDIDCLLNALEHSQVLETTKQHVIMNVDTLLSEAEASSKLEKINKLVGTMVAKGAGK